jgi:dihydroxyacid dehydratase/phosphogluconate dehydratase
VTDPCDGRTQGTTGMMDSLPYRNDAALVLGRLIRSLPTRKAVLGVATCDKGLPAMLMALAACHDLAAVADSRRRDAAAHRWHRRRRGADDRRALLRTDRCRWRKAAPSAAVPAHRREAAANSSGRPPTSQVVAEALGLTVPHAALAPSGQPIWTDVARRSARAAVDLSARGIVMRDILTDGAIRNAMTGARRGRRLDEPALHIRRSRTPPDSAAPRSPTGSPSIEQVPRIVDVPAERPRIRRSASSSPAASPR